MTHLALSVKYSSVVIIGPPGSGKGTQGEKLAELASVGHISTGDALRRQESSPLGKKYQATLAEGEFFPDHIAMQLVRQEIEERGYTHNHLIFFDGVPRTVRQVPSLDEIAQVLHVISLHTSDEDFIRGRVWRRNTRKYDRNLDDTKRRIREYRELTFPVIAEYERRGFLSRTCILIRH